MPVIVVENDPFTRLVGMILDPGFGSEARAAFADFFAHDEPDFDRYCEQARARAPNVCPSIVRVVEDAGQLRARAGDADAFIVESIPIGAAELAAAPRLKVIQKHGVNLRTIDVEACAKAGVKVLTLRRRANIACAEVAMALILMLSRRLHRLAGRVTAERLGEAGYRYEPFDTRHTGRSNWARIPGMRTVFETTVGIIGLGEIGRELALRANAFGMRVLYYQRNRWLEADEREMAVAYRPLDALLAESDWVVPILPSGPQTLGLIGRGQLERMKPGACLVNVSRADVVDRAALVEALRSGRLAGLALDPQYDVPVRDDDSLLGFDNVILTPHIAAQPRFNALQDTSDMIAALGREFTP